MTIDTGTAASGPHSNGSKADHPASWLRRQYTVDTPGAPYDHFEWERRDIVQKHATSGEIIFEQLGVLVPKHWGAQAAQILATKYLRQTSEYPREDGLQTAINRIVGAICDFAVAQGRLTPEEAMVVSDELKFMMVDQRFSFNSPVWFNIGVPGRPQRASACFILDVQDTLDSIYEWCNNEGKIFAGGSGAGVNLSRIRSSAEKLSSGHPATGPVSFMRMADSAAGVIASGASTRKAAKMVVLDVDHPDVQHFIWCKANEGRKARVLEANGFAMGLDDHDMLTLQYQNANNSVRVSDEFMMAVEADEQWELRARTTGEVVARVSARQLWREIAEAAWECADPGLQYSSTINRWNALADTEEIVATNPCFPGSALVHTDRGLLPIAKIVEMATHGDYVGVYTHDATSKTDPAQRVEVTTPVAFMVTGTNPIVRLEFSDGRILRCTPNHRIWTTNRGWVRADELDEQDAVQVMNQLSLPAQADYLLPVSTDFNTWRAKGEPECQLQLPQKWTDDFAHYLGWLTGDGAVKPAPMVATIYGNDADRQEIKPRHERFLAEVFNGSLPAPVTLPNGEDLLRMSRSAWRRFLTALGITDAYASGKRVPWSVMQAPADIQAAYLRGLFDADGSVSKPGGGHGAQVSLSSTSQHLLVDVQKMLSQFGIVARIYKDQQRDPQRQKPFTHTRANGEQVEYTSRSAHWRLTVTSRQIEAYARYIGFTLSHKQQRLQQLADTKWLDANSQVPVNLVSRTDDGIERTYNLTEPRNHSYVVDGVVVSNCGEFVYINNTACNLASINLLRYYDDETGAFDTERFAHDAQLVLLAMELLVDLSDYPTDEIAENSHRLRPLGLGYTNLGALLMRMGLPYDSDDGRQVAASITSLLGGASTLASVQFAQRWGAYEGYTDNKRSQLRVLQQHLDAAADLAQQCESGTQVGQIADQAHILWEMGVKAANKSGIRNGQVSLLAPTGTISFLMGADTTGVEPDLALSKHKKLVGGGSMQIVNQSVLPALRRLGYDEETAEIIAQYMRDNNTPEGAPGLDPEHYTVFACAMTTPTISPMGHVAMMGAVQPFLSGAISKTVNMPADSTVDDVAEVYFAAWQAGCKDIAIYRDNSKLAQPLSAVGSAAAGGGTVVAAEPQPGPQRRRLPTKRHAMVTKFNVGGLEGYLTVGEYDDGTPGEVFIKTSKQGSTLEGVMDGLAIVMSLGLQHGVPLETYIKKFLHTKFDPAGITEDHDLRMSSSVLDYIGRRLALDYLPVQQRHALGIKTTIERIEETDLGSSAALPAAAPAPADPAPAKSTALGTHICSGCGGLMHLHGSCWLCEGCGTSSGCS